MDVTEVRIKLIDDPGQDRLLGFCSITIDGAFVVRDLKIINGSRGPFVAMPSRKLCDRCPQCGGKNHLRASYCGNCGLELDGDRSLKLPDGKAKLYADIAHPINSHCRDLIQDRVLESFEKELELAKQDGYVCRYDDYDSEDLDYEEEPTSRMHRLDAANEPPQPGPHRRATVERQFAENEGFGEGVF